MHKYKGALIRIFGADYRLPEAVSADTNTDHRSHGLFEAFYLLCRIIYLFNYS